MLFPLALLATAATARVISRLPSVPQGWRELRTAEDAEPIVLRLALRQQHAAVLEQAVLDVSTPGHPKYGRHLSRDEVRALVAPSAEAVGGVTAWLDGHGVRAFVDNDWVTVATTVGKANALLDTRFAWYEYEGGQGQNGGARSAPKLRTLRYSLPDELAGHVDMVQPTTRFGQPAGQKSTIFEVQPAPEEDQEDDNAPAALSAAQVPAPDAADAPVPSCAKEVTPQCLHDLYDIHYTASAEGNLVAFASYLEEYARYADLQTFESRYLPTAKGQNFTVELVNGGLDDQSSKSDSVEANLDVQAIVAVSHPIPVLEYSTAGRGPLVPTPDEPTQPGSNEPYLEFLTHVLAQPDGSLPQTLSTSYGEEEQSIPEEYALKVCNLFMQLGARGVSVLFSSGDSGPGNSCIRVSDGAPFFNPTFPAGCPYVTAVGGTTGTGPEKAVDFSSGGFSIYHERPAYQDAAVSAYLASGAADVYAPYFNKTGRGIPDVAAQGRDFVVYDKGSLYHVGGTSASSPAFAGVVALLNAARRSKGDAPLGFLNPWLYGNAAALTDITAGYGSGCGGNRKAFPGGARWNATEGWDPVTGLGTPKFGALLAAAAPGVENK